MLPKISNYRNLTDIVYKTIKDAIIQQKLEPKQKLTEKGLAEQLGVSKTPVREALHKLEKEGLIEIVPNKGYFVTSILPEDINEIYNIREALEILAAKLATPQFDEPTLTKMRQIVKDSEISVKRGDQSTYFQMDALFHNLLVQASKNKRLFEIFKNIRDQIQVVRVRALPLPGRLKKSYFEHKKIIDALLKRDFPLVEKWISIHIAETKKDVLKAIEQIKKGG